MPTIVISYRRADAAGTAGRMFDKLVSHFGEGHVFMDIDSIPAGTNFRRYLRDILSRSDIVLAVIGPRWMGEGGRRRIAEDSDLVRFEVQTALEQNIPLIPVLVDHADMPRAEELPAGLQDIVDLNAVEVRPGRDFHVHMDRLIRSIEALLRDSKPVPDSTARAEEADQVSTETEPPTEPAVARLLSDLAKSAITVAASSSPQRANMSSAPPPAPKRGAPNATSDEQRIASRADDDEAAAVPDFLQSGRGNASVVGAASPQRQAGNDKPRASRRRSLIALALIAYAAVATVASYRFSTHYGVPSASNPPPVITADYAPTKAAPDVNADNDNDHPRLGGVTGLRIVPAREVLPPPAAAPALKSKTAGGDNPPGQVSSSSLSVSAPTPNGAVTGGYVVQLGSQRSEAEAQASFRALQAKYPDQLGNRSVVIRRADLGDRGVYYRTTIGPFARAEDANEFCSALKAAGGQCLIQRY